MRIIRIIAIFVVITGFVIKLFHIHYHTVVILTGLSILMADSIASFFITSRRRDSIRELALCFWLIFLLFALKFFPYYQLPLIIAAVLSLLAVRKASRTGVKKGLFTLVVVALISLTAFLIPAHIKYYYTSIKWNYEIDTDYMTWDRYSWHLYRSEQYEDAINASEEALRTARGSGDSEWITIINSHMEAIRNRNWSSYKSQ